MAKEFLKISDGTFTLTETEVENQLYFFRNDGGVLSAAESIAFDFYQDYLIKKTMLGETDSDFARARVKFEKSNDDRYIRLTVIESDTGELTSSIGEKKKNSFKSLLKKIGDKLKSMR